MAQNSEGMKGCTVMSPSALVTKSSWRNLVLKFLSLYKEGLGIIMINVHT